MEEERRELVFTAAIIAGGVAGPISNETDIIAARAVDIAATIQGVVDARIRATRPVDPDEELATRHYLRQDAGMPNMQRPATGVPDEDLADDGRGAGGI